MVRSILTNDLLEGRFNVSAVAHSREGDPTGPARFVLLHLDPKRNAAFVELGCQVGHHIRAQVTEVVSTLTTIPVPPINRHGGSPRTDRTGRHGNHERSAEGDAADKADQGAGAKDSTPARHVQVDLAESNDVA